MKCSRENIRRLGAASLLAAAAASAAPALAGQTGTNATISLSGSTAMRGFTTSQQISFVDPNTQVTLSNGTYPANLSDWTGPNAISSFQLAPSAPNSTFSSTAAGAQALRIEWHEQGSVEGILELVNSQIKAVSTVVDPVSLNPVGFGNVPGPSVANPTWVNRTSMPAYAQSAAGVFGLTATNTGANNPGPQNAVQLAISDVNARQGFSIAGTPADFRLNPVLSPKSTVSSPGYGKGNPALLAASNTNGIGKIGTRQQLLDESTLAYTGTTPSDPQHNQTFNNVENKVVAQTATLFVANPGTGLDRVNRTDVQWLQTTGRLRNGADFNMVTRDVNSGTRNVAALNTGVDPSWASGENDGGSAANAESNLGSITFSNKSSGGNLRNAVQNSRMSVGTFGIADAVATTAGNFTQNGSTKPIRALDYSDSADGSKPYVRASASSITDGSYVIWQNETYVTVKALDAQYGTGAPNIKGDPTGDVKAFRSNILGAEAHFPAATVNNPADGLIQTGFILPQLMKVRKAFDGVDAAESNLPADGGTYSASLGGAFLASPALTQKFSVGNNSAGPAGTPNANSAPSGVTGGTGSTYGNGGSNAGDFNGAIKITAPSATTGNYLFGNFNQNGVRDYSAVLSAQAAQLQLEKSGVGNSMFTAAGGSNNDAKIDGVNGAALSSTLKAMAGQDGTTGATKGDLIVLGDYNADGKFNGKDLYLMARGAALADNASSTTLTVNANVSLGDALRNGVLRKNAALDDMQAATAAKANDDGFNAARLAQRTSASVNSSNPTAVANAFNKFDVNRDGVVSRRDAAIVDKFVGKDYRNIDHQLAATINADGAPNGANPVSISLVDVELTDSGDITASGPTSDFGLMKIALGSQLVNGDANFDGTVDGIDLGLLATNFLGNGKWSQGDFNLDGTVDGIDLGQLATNFLSGPGGANLTADQIKSAFVAAASSYPEFAGLDLNAVPEPGHVFSGGPGGASPAGKEEASLTAAVRADLRSLRSAAGRARLDSAGTRSSQSTPKIELYMKPGRA